MKLEGAEAINQLQDLADLIKYQTQPSESGAISPESSQTLQRV